MKGQVDTGCSSALQRKITTIVFPGENLSLIQQYPLPFILIHVDTCNLFDDGYKEGTSMTSEKALIKSYKFKLVCNGVTYQGLFLYCLGWRIMKCTKHGCNGHKTLHGQS